MYILMCLLENIKFYIYGSHIFIGQHRNVKIEVILLDQHILTILNFLKNISDTLNGLCA